MGIEKVIQHLLIWIRYNGNESILAPILTLYESEDQMKGIESAGYYFITGINEPEENSLEFEVICGMVSEKEEDLFIGNQNLGPVRPILMNMDHRYKIKFSSYIGYAVLNESYVGELGSEFTGRNPRVYSNSNFLAYIKADTFATRDYPGAYKHYAFLGENHVLNIVAVSEPEIEKVE